MSADRAVDAVEMKQVFAVETIDSGNAVLVAGEYGAFPLAEAKRLIANGAALDPDEMIVPATAAATFEAKDAEIAQLKAELDGKQSALSDQQAALSAAHAEIDRLTAELTAGTAKKK